MIAQVARMTGSSVVDTARAPYALTLWTFVQNEERRRLESLVVERQQLDMAHMMVAAYHDPPKLSRFESEWRSKLYTPESRVSEREETLRAASELLARRDRQMEH